MSLKALFRMLPVAALDAFALVPLSKESPVDALGWSLFEALFGEFIITVLGTVSLKALPSSWSSRPSSVTRSPTCS